MSKKELTGLIDSFNNKENAFQLQPVTCENIEKCIKMIRNDSRRNMIIILSLTNNFYNKQFHQNKSIPRHMESP